MLAPTKRVGKCLMRQRIEPLKRETVCSGTSCLRATRNPASTATRPWIGVGLVRCQQGAFYDWDTRRCALFRGRCQCMPQRIDEEGEYVGYHRREKQKLGKLCASPCSFEVSSSEPYHQTTNGKGDSVVFHESRCQSRPRELETRRGDEHEVRYR